PWVARCAADDASVSPFLDVSPGSLLDREVLRRARLLRRGDRASTEPPQPFRPLRPPAARHGLRSIEPFVGVGRQLGIPPVVALARRRRIDHAGDMAARPKGEPGVAAEEPGRRIGGLPGKDVVLARTGAEAARADPAAYQRDG